MFHTIHDDQQLSKGNQRMKTKLCSILTLLTFVMLTFVPNGFAQEPMLLEHGGGVRTIAFSPVDASLVASAGESHTIKLWNLADNTVRTLIGHTDRVNSVAFSPDGDLLASVSDDRTIRLWNVHNQQNIVTLQDRTQFRSVAFSPNGHFFATGGGMHVKLWDVHRRAERTTLPYDKWVQAIAFSPDGQLLAVGGGTGDGPGTIKVWDVQTQLIIAELEGDPRQIRAVAFSPDSRYLASSGWNGQLMLWDVFNWELLRAIPRTAYYGVVFFPKGKMVAGTKDGYISVWSVEDGAKIVSITGPTGRIHPISFSPDGTSLAAGGEDGMVRIWSINTSLGSNGSGELRILHVDTYLQYLPDANSAKMDNIPEPDSPPIVVRDFFQLDSFYEQWVNVGGLPVVASLQVNPYALKEAAWLIRKMIGHRPDVLRAMVGNKVRFSVIAYTEIITDIPEYNDHSPDFFWYRIRGLAGMGASGHPAVTSGEENILGYPGNYGGTYNTLIHEFGHAIHSHGLSTVDPTFDNRLQIAYESAMQKGLWQRTSASLDRKEYWAEGTQAWFHPNGAGSFGRFGNTRQALKAHDPDLAALLTEIYGDAEWRYTPVETRADLPHLQGFNPQDSPTFGGWPELAALYQQLRNPNSDGGGEWMDLKPHNPNLLSKLNKSRTTGAPTMVIFVNFTHADVLIYSLDYNGVERFSTRCRPGEVRGRKSKPYDIWLVKDTNGRNLAVFRAEEKTGRALIKSSEPVPVTLSHFRAERTDAGAVLKWTTESELDNAGFYILRSETKNGTFKAINPTLIQGAGTTSERNTYTWTDTTAKPNTVYYYQIEDISHAGVRKQLATVRMRGFVSASGKLTTRWADLKVQN